MTRTRAALVLLVLNEIRGLVVVAMVWPFAWPYFLGMFVGRKFSRKL